MIRKRMTPSGLLYHQYENGQYCTQMLLRIAIMVMIMLAGRSTAFTINNGTDVIEQSNSTGTLSIGTTTTAVVANFSNTNTSTNPATTTTAETAAATTTTTMNGFNRHRIKMKYQFGSGLNLNSTSSSSLSNRYNYNPCSICNKSTNEIMKYITNIVPNNTVNFLLINIQCYQLNRICYQGQYTDNQCSAIQSSTIPQICGCTRRESFFDNSIAVAGRTINNNNNTIISSNSNNSSTNSINNQISITTNNSNSTNIDKTHHQVLLMSTHLQLILYSVPYELNDNNSIVLSTSITNFLNTILCPLEVIANNYYCKYSNVNVSIVQQQIPIDATNTTTTTTTATNTTSDSRNDKMIHHGDSNNNTTKNNGYIRRQQQIQQQQEQEQIRHVTASSSNELYDTTAKTSRTSSSSSTASMLSKDNLDVVLPSNLYNTDTTWYYPLTLFIIVEGHVRVRINNDTQSYTGSTSTSTSTMITMMQEQRTNFTKRVIKTIKNKKDILLKYLHNGNTNTTTINVKNMEKDQKEYFHTVSDIDAFEVTNNDNTTRTTTNTSSTIDSSTVNTTTQTTKTTSTSTATNISNSSNSSSTSTSSSLSSSSSPLSPSPSPSPSLLLPNNNNNTYNTLDSFDIELNKKSSKSGVSSSSSSKEDVDKTTSTTDTDTDTTKGMVGPILFAIACIIMVICFVFCRNTYDTIVKPLVEDESIPPIITSSDNTKMKSSSSTSKNKNKSVRNNNNTKRNKKKSSSSNNSSTTGSTENDNIDDEYRDLFSNNAIETIRTVNAPAGKLGLVVDTTINGPIIHKLFSTSPLQNKVFVGEYIIGLNKIDTRSMSAITISELLFQTAFEQRTLTILSTSSSL